jgi:orotidine-5'-phosphate decarboxylase
MSKLIVAIDTNIASTAISLARDIAPHCGMVKLGLEYFLAHGIEGVRAINDRPVFLDLKLHDIPNTVAASVRAIAPARPAMLTLHAAGGAAMIEAARRAADQWPTPPILLAVTVLTSMDQAALNGVGVSGSVMAQVVRLGKMAIDAGADGLVCAASELPALRDVLGPKPVLVVPGIRLPGPRSDDQSRTATPEAAMAAGADWIVVGRPITTAEDPVSAAAAINAHTLTPQIA